MSDDMALNTSRSAARDAAFRAAYAVRVGKADIGDAVSPDTLGQTFQADLHEFILRLVRSAGPDSPSEGRFVPHLSKDWPLERLSVTDSILLSLACHELWDEPTVPPKVTISEYVKLAKLYGTADSGRFLNGVLSSVLKTSPKADWELAPGVEVRGAEETEEEPPEQATGDLEERPEAKSRWVLKSDG